MEAPNPHRRVLFVAGVHGAGKTTLARSLATELECPFKSAGELLREKGVHPDQKVKTVRNVEGNQDALVAALDQLDLGNSVLILDGHFCLLNSDGLVQPVPMRTFQSMGLVGIILVEAEVGDVHDRLSVRDGTTISVETIAALQVEERTRARLVSEELHVPLFQTRSSEAAEAVSWSRKTLNFESL